MATVNGASAAAKDALAVKGGDGRTEERKPLSPEQQLWTLLKGREKVIAQALPKHMTAERMAMVAFSEIRKNPKIASCSRESLLAAVLTASQLGLEPGILGHCYFVPYWNPKTRSNDVQLQIGYKGMLELARRSGEIEDIYGYVVYEADEFALELGLRRDLKHRPAMGSVEDRGKPIGAYVVALIRGASKPSFEFMPWREIERRRDRYSKNCRDGNGNLTGPWKDAPEEMAIKTVVRHLWKWLPVSIEVQRAVEEDGSVRTDVGLEPLRPDAVETEGATLPVSEDAPEDVPPDEPAAEVPAPRGGAPKRQGGLPLDSDGAPMPGAEG